MTYAETIEKYTQQSDRVIEFFAECEMREAVKSYEYIGYKCTVMPTRNGYLVFLKVGA